MAVLLPCASVDRRIIRSQLLREEWGTVLYHIWNMLYITREKRIVNFHRLNVGLAYTNKKSVVF